MTQLTPNPTRTLTADEQRVMDGVVATMTDGIARLRACTDNGLILAWPKKHLGVAWADGKPFACALDRAEVVATADMPDEAHAYVPVVSNGAGERAQLVRRQDVIPEAIASLEASLANLIRVYAPTSPATPTPTPTAPERSTGYHAHTTPEGGL